jgi:pectate lyase
VTNLNDSGPGSLREGIKTAAGPRTIVFDISGRIDLLSPLKIEKPRLTIAGQTAPGDGITLSGNSLEIKKTSDIIIRYLRIRLGDKHKEAGGADGISVDYCDNIIFDHLSVSWTIDGIQDERGCKNYTMQWCILSEALHHSIHPKGPHAMCASFRAPLSNMTIHHNLFSTSRDRHPTLGGGEAEPQWAIDFRNNVDYNWSGAANVCDNQVNLINNFFRPGPETDVKSLPIAMKSGLPDKAHGYMSGNVFEERDDLTENNYAAIDFKRWIYPGSSYQYAGTLNDWKVDHPFYVGDNAPVTQSAKEACELVLSYAGASLRRDAVDVRVTNDVRNRTGKLLDSQDEVGGWPELKTLPVPVDSDGDGMPDTWEKDHQRDPQDPKDGNTLSGSGGYTHFEEYINSLCPAGH